MKSAVADTSTRYRRLNELNSVSVTGRSRSTSGSVSAAAVVIGLPAVAMMSGAEPDRPPCQTVPSPR